MCTIHTSALTRTLVVFEAAFPWARSDHEVSLALWTSERRSLASLSHGRSRPALGSSFRRRENSCCKLRPSLRVPSAYRLNARSSNM